MSSVFEREMRRLDTRSCNAFVRTHYENAMTKIKNESDPKTVRTDVLSFIRECSSKAGSEYFKECMRILDEMGGNEKYKGILDECYSRFVCDVVPYMERPIHALSFSMGCFNLHDGRSKALQEVCDNIHICDRIIDNHKKLSKRFKLDEIAKFKSANKIATKVCEMVDTYDIKPHIKMELVFEESIYLADKFGFNINHQALVETVTDYFLAIPSNNEKLIKEDYPRTIKESKVLNLDADRRVAYLTGRDTRSKLMRELMESSGDNTSVKDLINQYKTETNKSDSIFKKFMNKIFTQSPQAIIDETPDILKWVRNFGVLGVLSKNAIAAVVVFLVNGYVHYDLRKKETTRIIKYFKKEKDSVDDTIFDTMDDEKREKLEAYSKELEDAINKLEKYNDELYTDNERFNQEDDDVEMESFTGFNEAKVKIQMNTMVNDAIDADKFIDKIAKETLEKMGVTKTDIKDNLTTESFINHLDPDGRISVTISNYAVPSSINKDSLYEIVDSIIGTTNNFLRNSNSKVCYTILGESIDFVMRSKFKIITSFAEDAMACSDLTDSEKIRIGRLYKTAQYAEQLESMNPNRIITQAIRKVGKLNLEQYKMFIEAWSYGAIINEEDMDRFVDYYCKYLSESGDYIDSYDIKHQWSNIKQMETPCIECVVESTKIMQDIVNEAVDLNSFKLAWMAFKKKMKDFSAKEKEACRDLDMAFNNFTKAVKNFYGKTDHREQIIKGQVNPSISKILKIGMSLAAVGVAANSIVLPAILLVGGIAMNKHTTDKEKKMILDEIDIELKVVEREISRCESAGKSSRKYRTLLTYQKNLQREKQRIVYGLSRKGITLPSSNAGLPGGDS